MILIIFLWHIEEGNWDFILNLDLFNLRYNQLIISFNLMKYSIDLTSGTLDSLILKKSQIVDLQKFVHIAFQNLNIFVLSLKILTIMVK